MAARKPRPSERRLGAETARSHPRRVAEGFIDRYLSGERILDIGFRGGTPDAVPVTEKAVGVELDYPGYDGAHLPFADGSQDAVFASHTLEHIIDYGQILADWYRVLRVGGYLVIAVPHQHLYERKASLPSRFNGDHKRFYTPASLLAEIEASLPVGGYRIRSLRDIDDGFSYTTPPEQHPQGCYEIELVVEKIAVPAYSARLVANPQAARMARFFAETVADLARKGSDGHRRLETQGLLLGLPLPPFGLLRPWLGEHLAQEDIAAVLRPIVEKAPFDEQHYVGQHPDVGAAVAAGACASARAHYVAHGYFEGRAARPVPPLFD